MKDALMAFSFAQLPHIRVQTLFKPVGATLRRELLILSLKSTGGKTPSDGRLRIDIKASGLESEAMMAGWLYPGNYKCTAYYTQLQYF